MLVALTKEGNLFTLGAYQNQKEEIVRLRQGKYFFCPACGQEVTLKLGTKYAWHFAHKRNLTCSVEMEGETKYHIDGKKLLYEWLSKQKISVELEPYLKEIKQRPDLLINTTQKKFAIELQCATISPELFIKRTQTYQKNNYIPIWILGGNQVKRTYQNIYRLSSFHWLFANSHSSSSLELPQIISFCPESKSFLFLKNITAISPLRSVATQIFLPLKNCLFPQLFSTRKNSFDHLSWNSAKQNWRLSSKGGAAETLVKKLYAQRGLSFMLFPAVAGVPTHYHYFIETPTYIWQSWVISVFISGKALGESIHVNLVIRAFQTLVKKGVFRLRTLPLIDSNDHLDAINCYLVFLSQSQTKILSTVDHQRYTIIGNVIYPKHIEEAIHSDRQVIELFHESKY